MSKTWEEVASVNVVGESIVIGRYQGGNISLKAALAPRRYAAFCTRVDVGNLPHVSRSQRFRFRHSDLSADAFQRCSCLADGHLVAAPDLNVVVHGVAIVVHTPRLYQRQSQKVQTKQ